MDTRTPQPPASRKVCGQCGDITASGHTSWLCRLFAWLDCKREKSSCCTCPDDSAVLHETDTLVLIYRRPLSIEAVEHIRAAATKQGIRATIVAGCDNAYVQRNATVECAQIRDGAA